LQERVMDGKRRIREAIPHSIDYPDVLLLHGHQELSCRICVCADIVDVLCICSDKRSIATGLLRRALLLNRNSLTRRARNGIMTMCA
jgi:hypothetical protein